MSGRPHVDNVAEHVFEVAPTRPTCRERVSSGAAAGGPCRTGAPAGRPSRRTAPPRRRGRGPGLEGLVDRPVAEGEQGVVAGQRPRVGGPELVVHQGPEDAEPHAPSLARARRRRDRTRGPHRSRVCIDPARVVPRPYASLRRRTGAASMPSGNHRGSSHHVVIRPAASRRHLAGAARPVAARAHRSAAPYGARTAPRTARRTGPGTRRPRRRSVAAAVCSSRSSSRRSSSSSAGPPAPRPTSSSRRRAPSPTPCCRPTPSPWSASTSTRRRARRSPPRGSSPRCPT